VTPKEQMLKAIEELPDEVGIEEVMDRLLLLYKIQQGIDQADAGQRFTQQEARERMARWLR
jgi:hypothetical protein